MQSWLGLFWSWFCLEACVVVAFLTGPSFQSWLVCWAMSVWDYHIGSNFWKFYLIKTSFTLWEPVSLVNVFRPFRLGMGGFFFGGGGGVFTLMYNILTSLSIGKARMFAMMPCWEDALRSNPKKFKGFFQMRISTHHNMNDDICVWKKLFCTNRLPLQLGGSRVWWVVLYFFSKSFYPHFKATWEVVNLQNKKSD